MKVICEECSHNFNPLMKERRLKKDFRELYIECPKCNDKHRVALTNKEIRKLQNTIIKIREIDSQEGSERLDMLTKKLKIKMDELNCKA